jgi:hypothetical protein
LIHDIAEVRQLWAEGIFNAGSARDLQASERRRQDIYREYVDAVAPAKEIEKRNKSLLETRKKLLKVDKDIKKANEFDSAIESLQGMWARIQTAAAGTRKDPTEELRKQRAELQKEARIRERQLNQLIDLNRRARATTALFA